MPRRPMRVISNWYVYLENFSTSALDFYSQVEEAVARREIPDAKTSRVTYKEGGLLSAKREYLRVERQGTVFDIGAAPFGRGYFFSWWLAELPGNPLLWLFYMGLLVFLLGVLFVVFNWIFGDTCGGIFFSALAFAFIGAPAFLYLLGYGVKQGAVGVDEEEVLGIPVIGYLYERIFQPATYYRLDTARMFGEAVRAAVMEVVDETLSGKGYRELSPEERRARDQLR